MKGQRLKSMCSRPPASSVVARALVGKVPALLLLPVLVLGIAPVFAQAPLDDLVVTVGTTLQDPAANNWSYVLLASPQPRLLAGKRFAVYGKEGYPTNAGTFTLRGNLFQQSDTNAIDAILSQSVTLGENLASLDNALKTLFRNVPGYTNLTLAQKLAAGFQLALNNPVRMQALSLIGRTHPGLTLCAGQAFTEQIAAPTTYEVREVDPNTGAAGDVLGRVTLTPGAPVLLPAPGRPFQVVTNGPIDHLRIRLRWGTPDALRRLSLLSFGFNLWRVPQAAAEAAGYDVTPPTLSQLYTDPNITRANQNPVMAAKNYSAGTGAGAADDPADLTTYFFADDNGRALGMPPFNDGDYFYYFVTARDILGRDGLVSEGRLARTCRRLPPGAPSELHVLNSIILTNQARLLVTWRQNTNATDAVSEYWVYRWPNPAMALTNDSAPYSNLVGVVAQGAATNSNAFLDDVTDSPTVPGSSNFWYTVRAVSQAACAPLLSPQSPPAWGVLRQRAAPDAVTGTVQGSCGTPAVKFQSSNLLTNSDGPDPNNWNYRLTCERRDPGIAWVQFYITNVNGFSESLARMYFAPGGDSLQLDYALPKDPTTSTDNYFWCTVGTYYGLVSSPAIAHIAASLGNTQRLEVVFLAGQLLETALDPADPLLSAVTGGGGLNCFPPTSAIPDPSGTVALTFPTTQPLLLQVQTSNTWRSLGVYAADASGVYWVSFPGCLVGPPPSYQGCAVALPAGDISDCAHHIPRASPDGPVAPMRIRFKLTPRTRDYRVYRSVDGGPLTLIAEGHAPFDPLAPDKEVVRTDDAMPPSSARLCYFVQVLDENGNGSPMAFLGCREPKPPEIPTPVLAEPQAAGDVAHPQVLLNWFCPTAGVYRFQIKVERADNPGTGQPTGLAGSNLFLVSTFDTAARYAGLMPNTRFRRLTVSSRIALSHFDEAQLTPPVGPGFGPGPQFSLTANVLPNVPYNICVSALDAQGYTENSSIIWRFTWTPPVVLANVPWPARPLPPVRNFHDDFPYWLLGTGAGSMVTFILASPSVVDKRTPVGIIIGDFRALAPYNFQTTLNAGTSNFMAYTVFGTDQAPDPSALITRRISLDPSRREPLLPIVVYRQQVTNAAFPRVSGHLTQVTPLLEKLAYSLDTVPGQEATVTIKDRLIVGCLAPVGVDNFRQVICLRDQQPVILGASYQYFIARFNEKRELEEVIPAGSITIPFNL